MTFAPWRALLVAGTPIRRKTGLSFRLAVSKVLLLSLWCCWAANAAEPDAADLSSALRTGSAPEWVEVVPWTMPAGAPPAGAAAQIILSESQDRLTTHGSDFYAHSVVRLLTSEGVRAFAQQTNEISPDFEKVTWHTLRLHRDGKIIERLPTAQFKKLQRELALEAQMLTGQTTFAAVLDDVRVGDVLETAYTLHYNNPLFEGRIGARHHLGSPYPMIRERIVIRFPANGPAVRSSFLVPDGTNGLPENLYRLSRLQSVLSDETRGDERVISWECHDLEAIEFDNALPARAYPYWPRLRVSSFTTWADVVEWAEPLFAADSRLPDPLPGLIETWKREPDPSARLAAAVHWVQNDIRYFGLELGQHNFRPRAIADVCSSRYGDCKDKALLLVMLLRALGLEAWPALVSTAWRDRLHAARPDPYAFNHAVVAYQFGGKMRWIDATLKDQQGRPGEWAFPPYRTALIIRPRENALVDIANGELSEPDTIMSDFISIDPITGDATIATEVTLRGLQADFYRQTLNTVSASERSKQWFNFVARFYRRLEEVEPPVVKDNAEANKIFLRARYRMPEFVQKDAAGSAVAIYAYGLRALLDPPESRRRHWPYALPSDRFIRHRIQVELPFDMPVEQQPELIRTDGLEYRVDRAIAGRRFIAQHELRITSDSVDADRMGPFVDAVEEIFTGLSTSIHRPTPAKSTEAKPTAASESPTTAAN